MVNFKTQNSVQDMVEVLKVHGTLSEKEISTKAFGYTEVHHLVVIKNMLICFVGV